MYIVSALIKVPLNLIVVRREKAEFLAFMEAEDSSEGLVRIELQRIVGKICQYIFAYASKVLISFNAQLSLSRKKEPKIEDHSGLQPFLPIVNYQ